MLNRSLLRCTTRLAVLALVGAFAVPTAGAQTLLTVRPTVNTTTINFANLTSDTWYSFASFAGGTVEPISDAEFYSVGTYGLGDNGSWNTGGASATGIGTGTGFGSFLRFTFDTPIAAAGGFVNYCLNLGATCNGFSATLRAFDSDFNVIGAYDVDIDAPINTLVDNDGAFRGIAVDTPSIKYLDWGGSYVVMGDLTFGDAPVTATPEPASLVLLASGLFAIGGVVRVRKRNA
ncbi:MAG: PEP-CTERM sorting domain-containing protein [bacterium]